MGIPVAHGVGLWPGPHQEPFDRMLMAQSQAENIPLISNEWTAQRHSLQPNPQSLRISPITWDGISLGGAPDAYLRQMAKRSITSVAFLLPHVDEIVIDSSCSTNHNGDHSDLCGI